MYVSYLVSLMFQTFELYNYAVKTPPLHCYYIDVTNSIVNLIIYCISILFLPSPCMSMYVYIIVCILMGFKAFWICK